MQDRDYWLSIAGAAIVAALAVGVWALCTAWAFIG